MHFAAKYYALGAFRISTNEGYIRFTEKSLELLFYSDYKQGSWFNALDTYIHFIMLNQSNGSTSDYIYDNKINQKLSVILYTMREKSFQFTYFIDSYIKSLGYIGEEIIKPFLEKIDETIKTKSTLESILENKIDDFPLNDVDKIRIVSFYALGSLWKISFENKFELMAIAEEYIANIQIVLAEISLSGIDFHLFKSTIELELVLSGTQKIPNQVPSNEIVKWQIYVNNINVPDTKKMDLHTEFNTTSLLSVLQSISLLKSDEFQDLFFELLKNQNLENKQVSVNLYQRLHRDIYYQKDFDNSMRRFLQKERIELNLPFSNHFMKWNDSLSKKYNKIFSIEAIKNRFNNSYKSIHLTLERLKKEENFVDFINNLRLKGWKDWQIVCNISNFIINRKVNNYQYYNGNDTTDIIEERKSIYLKFLNMDEKDCYLKFTLDDLKCEEFASLFNLEVASLLQTNGLEINSETPNFKAIKEFLDIRFNLINDDYEDNNPLREI